MKGISFLPKMKNLYPQMPYEEITKEEYQNKMQLIDKLQLDKRKDNLLRSAEEPEDPKPENYCDADFCKI